MMKKRAGAIVNVSSIVGVHGNWGQTNYAASKAGIIGFTKSLARELGSRNVRANVVAPGYVTTQLTDVLPEEATQAMLQQTPLGRLGDPGDVAGAVRFLCSDAAILRDGRSAARRRRPRNVAWMPVSAGNGRRRVVVTGIGAVTSLGNTVEDTWDGSDRGTLRRRPDHAVRLDGISRPLRVRGARPRPHATTSTTRRRGGWTASPISPSPPRDRRRPIRASTSRRSRTGSARPSPPGSGA